jgi:hypothetical protein
MEFLEIVRNFSSEIYFCIFKYFENQMIRVLKVQVSDFQTNHLRLHNSLYNRLGFLEKNLKIIFILYIILRNKI